MALKLVFAYSVLFVFAYCESKPENCREKQCKLLPVGEGFASEFRRKANEKGVRLVYLNLKIGNNSYDPLELQDEFLPHRWVWADTITEPMLSLPDDYDILSMGLLTYQVRNMDVQLQDEPSGCLADLNSTCQNLAVGRMLLQNVTMGSSDELSLETRVVCVAVLNWSIQFHQHINYNCCSMHKGRNGPSTVCDLTFYGHWFNGFDGIIITLWILMSLFIPALPLLLPDCVFSLRREIDNDNDNENLSEQRENRVGPADQQNNIGRADEQMNEASRRDQEATAHNRNSSNGEGEMIIVDLEYESPESDPSSNEHHQWSEPYTSTNGRQQRSEPYTSSNGCQQREEENNMIPVDDASPMTFSTLLLKCSKADVGLSFNIKLFLVYVFVLPCFIYLQLGLYNTLKKTHINESIKRRISLGKIFTKHIHWAIFATFGVKEIIWFVTLTFTSFSIVLFLRPKNFIFEQGTSCRICKEDHKNRASNHSLGDEMVLHLKIVPDRLKKVILKFKILLSPLPMCRKSYQAQGTKHKISFFSRSIFILFTLLLRVVFGAICFPFILVWSLFVVFWYSPLPVIFWFFVINEPTIHISSSDAGNMDVCKNRLLKLYAFFGSMSFCYTIVLVIVMSCGFINKVLGYTIAGLVLNEDVITPYVAFFFVVTTNIYLCYANMQNKYKEVKEMIFKRQRELEINNNDPEGTIPTELFWFVCDRVLPIKSEIWRMFCNMAFILLFLFLVVYSIIVFGNEYKVSAVFSTIYVFIGGLIPALVFKGLTKGNKFIGEAKMKIEREIVAAVTEYRTI